MRTRQATFLMSTAPEQAAEARGFECGAWFAFDEVLGWINTWPEQTMDKKILYKRVMELRPATLLSKYLETQAMSMPPEGKVKTTIRSTLKATD